MKSKKKVYSYPIVSIKINKELVEQVRANKKKYGVSIQCFVERAVTFALSQKPLKQS